MKNTVLKISFVLGLLTISGNPLSAGKTWDEIQREKNPGVIIQKVEDHLSKLREENKKNPAEYTNAKVGFWEARMKLVHAYFDPSLRKVKSSQAFKDIDNVESNAEHIKLLKITKLSEKIKLLKEQIKLLQEKSIEEKAISINKQSNEIKNIAPPLTNCRQEFAGDLSNAPHKEMQPTSASAIHCGDY